MDQATRIRILRAQLVDTVKEVQELRAWSKEAMETLAQYVENTQKDH